MPCEVALVRVFGTNPGQLDEEDTLDNKCVIIDETRSSDVTDHGVMKCYCQEHAW